MLLTTYPALNDKKSILSSNSKVSALEKKSLKALVAE